MISVLVADPPWPFRDKLPGPKRGAAKNYSLLTVGEICRFPLPELSANAVLFLWRVSSQQDEALQVARIWGFRPTSEIVWVKTRPTVEEPHRLHFGMGRSVRAAHETCLIATRGRPTRRSKSVRSVFFAPVPRDETGRVIHSAKPDVFYDLAEAMYPGPYGELFARRVKSGWQQWGNELGRLPAHEVGF